MNSRSDTSVMSLEEQEHSLAPRLSRASRNLLIGNHDSADEQEVFPSTASSDDVLHTKDYRSSNSMVDDGVLSENAQISSEHCEPSSEFQHVQDHVDAVHLEPRNGAEVAGSDDGSLINHNTSQEDVNNIHTHGSGNDPSSPRSESIVFLTDFAQLNANVSTSTPVGTHSFAQLAADRRKRPYGQCLGFDSLHAPLSEIEPCISPTFRPQEESSSDTSVQSDLPITVRKSTQRTNLSRIMMSKDEEEGGSITGDDEDDVGTKDLPALSDWVNPLAVPDNAADSTSASPMEQQPSKSHTSDPEISTDSANPAATTPALGIVDPAKSNSGLTVSSCCSRSTVFSTCSKETDIGNSGRSSPLFAADSGNMMEVLKKKKESGSPSSHPEPLTSTPLGSGTFPFRLLEAKLAALTDESDMEGPILSQRGKLRKKVSDDSDDSSADSRSTQESQADLWVRKNSSALIQPKLSSQPSSCSQTTIRKLAERKQSSNVSFNRSISVAMFHESGKQPTSDTENELEEDIQNSYSKKNRRTESKTSAPAIREHTTEVRTAETNEGDLARVEAAAGEEASAHSMQSSEISNSAWSIPEDYSNSGTSDSSFPAGPSELSSLGTYSSTSGNSSMILNRFQHALGAGSSGLTNTNSSLRRMVQSVPTATLATQQELSSDFILHVKKLLSLPNLKEEWKIQLHDILGQELTYPEGELTPAASNHSSSVEVAHVISEIIHGLMQNSGMSGLRLLAEAASQSAGPSDTGVSRVSSSGYYPSAAETSNSSFCDDSQYSDLSEFNSQEVVNNVDDISTPAGSTIHAPERLGGQRNLPTLFQLIRKIEQRDLQNARAGVGSIPNLASLSQMLTQYESSSSDSDSDTGGPKEAAARFVLDLVQMVVERCVTGNDPLNENLSDQEPAAPLEKNEGRATKDKDYDVALSGIGSIPDGFQTPSKLLAKQEYQDSSDPNSMDEASWESISSHIKSHGSVAVVNPKQLLKEQLSEKYKQAEVNAKESSNMSNVDLWSNPDCFHTPSKLLAKEEYQEMADPNSMDEASWQSISSHIKSHGSVAAVNPKQLLKEQLSEKYKQTEVSAKESSDVARNKKEPNSPGNSSPSKLLKKVLNRELEEDRMGVGSFETMEYGGTISQLEAKIDQQQTPTDASGTFVASNKMISAQNNEPFLEQEQKVSSTPPNADGKYVSVANWVSCAVNQCPTDIQTKSTFSRSLDMLVFQGPKDKNTESASISNTESHLQRVALRDKEGYNEDIRSEVRKEAQKPHNEQSATEKSSQPSRRFSITHNPSYCDFEGESQPVTMVSPSERSGDPVGGRSNNQGVQQVSPLYQAAKRGRTDEPDGTFRSKDHFQDEIYLGGQTNCKSIDMIKSKLAESSTLQHPTERELVVHGINLGHLGLKSPLFNYSDNMESAGINNHSSNLDHQINDKRKFTGQLTLNLGKEWQLCDDVSCQEACATTTAKQAYHDHTRNDTPTLSDLNQDQPTYSPHDEHYAITTNKASFPLYPYRGAPAAWNASVNPPCNPLTLSMLKGSGTASLPSSRGISPSPDSVVSSNRKSAGHDLRSFLVEKEVFESKLRKLQAENSSLHAENKLTKDKFNRAQARCQYLEAQLRTSQDEALSLRERYEVEVTSAWKRSRDRGDRDRQDLHDQVVRLTRDVEMVKAENALLEKQLESASRIGMNNRVSPDRSRFMDGFRTEIQTLKEELRKSQDLLQQCERDRKDEADKRKESSIQIMKLTEVKALLQQQLENAGSGTVAEKQVQSLERRLKITEERLHQERADRSGKLSEVEEKLINENAKLQVSDKEVRRQLHRERDKNRNLTDKYKDVRDENERLQGELAERPAILDGTPYRSKMLSLRSALGGKKHAEEVKLILEQIKKDENLGQGQENDIIWLLWHQKDEVARQLKEWEVALTNLNLDSSNVKDGLQALQNNHLMFDNELAKYKEAIEDSKREREEFLSAFQCQIQSLSNDKHTAMAKAKDLEDINAAITAENDSLKHSLRMTAEGRVPVKGSNVHTLEAQLEGLRCELRSAQGDLHQALRAEQAAENHLHSLRTQLDNKEQVLVEAMNTIDRMESSALPARGEEWKQDKMDKLHVEVKACQAEAKIWQDKYHSVKADLKVAEHENDVLRIPSKLITSRSAQPLENGVESEKLALEMELHEKDNQILNLTVSNNENESQLQRSRQRLLVEEQHSQGLTEQMNQLQTQLRQKNRLMEKMSNAESDYQVELQALRENVAAVNRELAQKNQELKMISVELNREQTKVAKLQQDLSHREQLLSEDIAALVHKGTLTSSLFSDAPASPRTTLTQAEMKVRMVEYEKESLRSEIERANGAVEALVNENTELGARIHEIKQELAKERAQLCQVNHDKAELEQKAHVLEEERDSSVRQRALTEQDLVRHETKTHQVIERLEQEAQQATVEYQQKYHTLDTEGKKMAVELGTTKRLLEARDKETDVLRDAVFRQKQEINSFHRRISVLNEENHICREDVGKLTKELALKIKENSVTMDTHQALSSDRAKLQMQKFQLEKDVTQLRVDSDRYSTELSDLKRKLADTEANLHSTEKRCMERETKVVALETNMQFSSQNTAAMETEHKEITALSEKINKEISSILHNSPISNGILFDEKMSKNHLRDELTHALHQVELIKQEHSTHVANLQSERRTVDTLKEKCQADEYQVSRLEDRIKMLEAENETLRVHLQDTKAAMEQYKADKQTLYQDVQDLYRKLSERDETIAGLQAQCTHTVQSVQQEYSTEKAFLAHEKLQAEDDLATVRKELEDTKEKLREKELQLEVYYRTSRDLQEESRVKIDLESQVTQLQSELSKVTWKHSSVQSDNSRLQETLQNAVDNLDKCRESKALLQEQLKEQREELTREIKELRTGLTEQAHKADMEKGELQDNYSRTQAELRAAEASLAAYTETKQSLYQNNRQLDTSLESLKTQQHEEVTARRLAEQRVEVLRGQLEEGKAKKAIAAEKIADLQSQLSRSESELSIEREKYRKLKRDMTETQNSSMTQDQHIQALQMQLAEVQAEVSSLLNQLETQKQNLGGKNKRLVLELKQQAADHDKERSKLLLEAQQLSQDLDAVRDQFAAKSRDSLRLQEENLAMDEKLREASRQARQAKDALKGQETTRDSLENRNMELELLLAKLRSKDADDSSFDATRAEVTRMLSDLSHRMQVQIDHQRNSESEARARDLKKIEELKNKVVSLEASVGQEQAMHIVTKTQAVSLEEDNNRLRQQLQTARKRLTHTGESEKSKSRLEEINDIIARSQTRAQQLLASGAYEDEPGRSRTPARDALSPARDYLSPVSALRRSMSPGVDDRPITMAMLNGSPENAYQKL